MKGSDFIGMTLNIAGELIKIDVAFDEQNTVRDAELAVKTYIERLKNKWPEYSDRKIIAMAAYQFALSYHQSLKLNQDAEDLAKNLCREIDASMN